MGPGLTSLYFGVKNFGQNWGKYKFYFSIKFDRTFFRLDEYCWYKL